MGIKTDKAEESLEKCCLVVFYAGENSSQILSNISISQTGITEACFDDIKAVMINVIGFALRKGEKVHSVFWSSGLLPVGFFVVCKVKAF